MWQENESNKSWKNNANPTPHPDLNLNLEKYHKQISYIHWLVDGITIEVCGKEDRNHVLTPEGKRELSSRVVEPTHILIHWKNNLGLTETFNISLHQSNMDFQKELCGALNLMGQRGFLEHRLRENDGRFRNSPLSQKDRSQWDKLFPTSKNP